jgi:hypothetical protein
MKIRLTVMLTILVLVCPFASISYGAGDCDAGPFDRFIKPISNPIYFDEATNRTYVNIVHMLQQLPNHINTEIGRLPLDGTLNVTATRINFAINDRFSLVAAKAGYVDFDPDNTLNGGNGWLDVGAGAKYAFILDPDNEFVLSGKVLFEFSNGSRDVYQGNGDGNVAPSLTFLKGVDDFQFMGTVGGIIPFQHNDESTLLYTSWHMSYAISEEFFPLIEVNYFRVIRNSHRKELAASVARWEGGDAINLGSHNGTSHRNFVTLALGARYRVFKKLDFGFAWETPLTTHNNGLMQNRYTIDFVFYF